MPRSWSVLDCFFSKQSKFQILFFDWSAGQPFKNSFFLIMILNIRNLITSLVVQKYLAALWEIWSIFSPNPASEKRKWKQFEQKDDIMMIWDSFFSHTLRVGNYSCFLKADKKNPFFILHIFFQPLNSESNSCHLP